MKGLVLVVAKEGRPLKFESVEELQEKIGAYFAECDKGKEIEVYDARRQEVRKLTLSTPYTITGLALALHTCRQTLLNYGEKDEFLDTIKTAKLRVENSYELSLRSNGGAGEIFGLKNFGWKDKTEQTVDLKAAVVVDLSKDEYKKARLEMLEKDDC